MDDQDTSSGGDKKATGVRTQSSLLYPLLGEVKQECNAYLSCEAVRVWKLPQIKITFSPHSVVQADSTEHPFCRRGRREADIGLTCFFCPVVKPPDLRSRWRRQIQARRLRSHTPGEVTVAAAAMAATVAATATAAASPTPPSASSRSRPAAAFTPPSPPTSGWCPGRKQPARRWGTCHVKGETPRLESSVSLSLQRLAWHTAASENLPFWLCSESSSQLTKDKTTPHHHQNLQFPNLKPRRTLDLLIIFFWIVQPLIAWH